jgi:hypothetical protein
MSKVFGIGLSRTGTTSLTSALTTLGYRATHFPSGDRTTREIEGYLLAGGVGPLRLSVLERVDAITDTPACCVYRGLDAAYPGSKFVLTVRDKAAWLESCRGFWARYLMPYLAHQGPTRWAHYVEVIHRHLYGSTDFDEALYSASYDRYVGGVREHFRADPTRLLVMDLCGGDGWDVLAPFLGAAAPAVPFPHANRGRASG